MLQRADMLHMQQQQQQYDGGYESLYSQVSRACSLLPSASPNFRSSRRVVLCFDVPSKIED